MFILNCKCSKKPEATRTYRKLKVVREIFHSFSYPFVFLRTKSYLACHDCYHNVPRLICLVSSMTNLFIWSSTWCRFRCIQNGHEDGKQSHRPKRVIFSVSLSSSRYVVAFGRNSLSPAAPHNFDPCMLTPQGNNCVRGLWSLRSSLLRICVAFALSVNSPTHLSHVDSSHLGRDRNHRCHPNAARHCSSSSLFSSIRFDPLPTPSHRASI